MNRSDQSKCNPRVIHSLPVLRRAVTDFHARGCKIALVRTMGALHEGHLSLVRLAQKRADRVIVSIFVNPTQFSLAEDLSTYPRTFATDIAALADLKVDLVWAPEVQVMYPQDFATRIVPEGAAKAGLEDPVRPHFLAGGTTAVAELLLHCEPEIALFGEKDYQQLKVVGQLVRDLALKTRIIGGPIVRERDGLALSSRNRYLSLNQRLAAPTLYRALKDCAANIEAGVPLPAALEAGRKAIADAGRRPGYFGAPHAHTPHPPP